MKKLAVYSLLVAMFLLAGCPVLTQNSIDEGSYEVPKWLPGKWHEVKDGHKKKEGYLLKKGDKTGNLTCYDIDSTGRIDNQSARRIILSTVGNKIFLCAFSPADGNNDEGYYLFEFRKRSEKEFELVGIKEHSIDYDAASKDILAFLSANKDNTDIYSNDDETIYKKD